MVTNKINELAQIYINRKNNQKFNINSIIKNKKLKQKKIQIILILAILFLVILAGISFAKYINKNIILSSTKIAKPVLELVNGSEIKINNNNKEGEYQFKVKNYNRNNEITQVGLNYNIEIISNKDNSIKFELYKNNEQLQIIDNKTKNAILPQNEKQEDNYKLKVIYNENSNKEGAADLMQDIQIKVHSEQEKI